MLPTSEESLSYPKFDSVTTQGYLVVIKVLPKIWRLKVQNRYIPPDYANDIDKGVFGFQ